MWLLSTGVNDGLIAEHSEKARNAFFMKLTWLRNDILINSHISQYD